jgi:hypothetical protein
LKFSELVRLLEENGFRIVKEKGSIRYYGKQGCARPYPSVIFLLRGVKLVEMPEITG